MIKNRSGPLPAHPRAHVIGISSKHGFSILSYTVTEKGTVTIPAHIRQKYKLKPGSKVGFVDTERDPLIVPRPSIEELRGVLSKKVG